MPGRRRPAKKERGERGTESREARRQRGSRREVGRGEQLFIWYGGGYFDGEDCLCESTKCLSKGNVWSD